MLRKLTAAVDTIEEYLLVSIVVLIPCTIFMQIVLRYIFHFVPSWMDELSVWLFVWSIWLGCSYCTRKSEHIKIEAFTMLLSKDVQHKLSFIINLFALFFLAVLCWYGFKQMMSPSILMQKSPVIINPISGNYVSMAILYAALPFGALFSCIRLVVNLFKPKE